MTARVALSPVAAARLAATSAAPVHPDLLSARAAQILGEPALGLDPQTVLAHLTALEAHGLLRAHRGIWHTFSLTRSGELHLDATLPRGTRVLRRRAAGRPTVTTYRFTGEDE